MHTHNTLVKPPSRAFMLPSYLAWVAWCVAAVVVVALFFVSSCAGAVDVAPPVTPPPGDGAGEGEGGASVGEGEGVASEGEGEGEGEGDGSPDLLTGVDLFAPDRVLDVAITIDPAEWIALAAEVPPQDPALTLIGPPCLPQNNPGFSYTSYEGSVALDGTVVDAVGIRKRDWCGSRSETKPSLKLDFNEHVPHREVGGLAALALNNSVQDPSFIRTCLAFEVFAAAGLPSSRCSFARVSVNGADMGLYVNVEHVDKRWLRRAFAGDDGGNLYKGFLGDFTAEREPFLLTERGDDRGDLDAVTAAIAAGDGASVAALVDLDEYETHWAAEVVLAHVDGYAGNTNNFYVYHRSDGKLAFIPWGPDTTFGTFGAPLALASSSLPALLSTDPASQAAYAAKLASVLDLAWDESALDAEADRMVALLDPDGARGLATQALAVKSFIDSRRAQLNVTVVP